MDLIDVRRSFLGGDNDACRTVGGRCRDSDGLSLVRQDGDLRHGRRRPRERIVEQRRFEAGERRCVEVDHLQEGVLGFLHLKGDDVLTRRTVTGRYDKTSRQERLVDGEVHRLVLITRRIGDSRQRGRTGREGDTIRERVGIEARQGVTVQQDSREGIVGRLDGAELQTIGRGGAACSRDLDAGYTLYSTLDESYRLVGVALCPRDLRQTGRTERERDAIDGLLGRESRQRCTVQRDTGQIGIGRSLDLIGQACRSWRASNPGSTLGSAHPTPGCC